MIRTWYVPTWSGDFRLEADGDKSKLVVSNPTPGELLQLAKFLTAARKNGWCAATDGIAPKGESTLAIAAPIADAGARLLGLWRRKGTLTAVRSVGGKVEAVVGDKPKEETKAVTKPTATAAATVRRPTLCCPAPVPGPEARSSIVLRTFCTEAQWEDWRRFGGLVAVGNLSGHRYRVVHRHSALAREQGKIVWDLDDDHVVKAYDWSVPPPEEVLQMKLVLEHAEHWIRNPSGYFKDDAQVYRNPFMEMSHQGSDGTGDTDFLMGVGTTLRFNPGAPLL